MGMTTNSELGALPGPSRRQWSHAHEKTMHLI
jgi:hypothetical protein